MSFALFVGFALKSTVVLAAAWLLTLALHRRSAAARHLVWTAAAAAILVLPLLSITLPSLRVPAAAIDTVAAPLVVTGSAATSAARRPPARGASDGAPQPSRAVIDWRSAILLLWALGAVALLVQAVIASIAVFRLRRAAPAFPDRALAAELAQRLGIESPIDIREAPPGTMPMTSGLFRPLVLIPSDASYKEVLLHELAHVRRADVAQHLIARAALILCWWNPLAWKAWREFVKERERAADDLVLGAGVAASDYAGRLLEVARGMRTARLSACAAVTMARRSQLEGRLLAILDTAANRRAATRASAIAAGVLALIAVAPLAAVRAQSGLPSEDVLPPDVDTFIRTATEQMDAAGLEKAAHAAVNLRKYDTAQRLMAAAADVQRQVSGPQSADYAMDLMRLARLAEKQHDITKAVNLYSRAANLLGNQPQAAPALFYLGANALNNKDYEGAIADFEQARNADPAQSGLALMWMAVARQRQGMNEEAAGLYRDALAHQSPESRDAVTTMTLFADFLKYHGNSEQAAELANRIAAARKSMQEQSNPLPARGDVYTVHTPGVQRPKLIDKTDPQYTEEARAAKLQGTEVLNVVVGADGLVHDAHVISGIGLGLDENGIDAVSQWRFLPATKDGQPVPVTATIEINFRLM